VAGAGGGMLDRGKKWFIMSLLHGNTTNFAIIAIEYDLGLPTAVCIDKQSVSMAEWARRSSIGQASDF